MTREAKKKKNAIERVLVIGPTFQIHEKFDIDSNTTARSITCLREGCGRTSWHPMDIERLYCRNCHKYHD